MTILWEFFPAKLMNRFIEYKTMIFEKKGKYPFVIVNTDSSDKNGTHWWSILDIEPHTDLFFFQHILVQWDDKKVVEKILFGTQLARMDNKITFRNIKFNLNICPKKSLII